MPTRLSVYIGAVCGGRSSLRAAERRREILRLLGHYDLSPSARGTQARLAAVLGVHRSTVCRDLWTIFRWRR